ALQPDRLAHGLDARRRNQTGAVGGNFIGAAILRFDAGDIREDLHRDGYMQTLFLPLLKSSYDRRRRGRRRGEILLGFHDLSSMMSGLSLVNITFVSAGMKRPAYSPAIRK